MPALTDAAAGNIRQRQRLLACFTLAQSLSSLPPEIRHDMQRANIDSNIDSTDA